jgi:hypothetical protein
MSEDEEDKHSSFSERMREWEAQSPDAAERLRREGEFFKAVEDALRGKLDLRLRAFYGHQRDELGGEMFYVYLKPPENTPIRLGEGFTKKDVTEAGEVLPQALASYFDGIPDAMKEALNELLGRVLQSNFGYFRPLDPFFMRHSWFPLNEVNIEYDAGRGVPEITRFPRSKHGGHKKPKLSEKELLALPGRLAELEALYRPIKEQHDAQKAAYEKSPRVQRNGYSHEQWTHTWVKYAQQLYELPDEALAQFAEQGATVSSIAYKELARQTGHKVSYLDKQVTKARKLRETAKKGRKNSPADI